MTFKQLSADFAVSAQVTGADLREAAAMEEEES